MDAGRSRSTYHERDAYIHDHCHEYVITMHFSISCPIVICLPTICYVFEIEASSENYGPGVYFYHIAKNKKYFAAIIYFYFTLQFIYLSLSELILASNEFKGIDN